MLHPMAIYLQLAYAEGGFSFWFSGKIFIFQNNSKNILIIFWFDKVIFFFFWPELHLYLLHGNIFFFSFLFVAIWFYGPCSYDISSNASILFSFFLPSPFLLPSTLWPSTLWPSVWHIAYLLLLLYGYCLLLLLLPKKISQ